MRSLLEGSWRTPRRPLRQRFALPPPLHKQGRRLRSANSRPAERKRRRGPTVAARELGLVGDSAVGDAIGEAGVGRFAAEVEVGLAGMADRPFADAVVELEQAGLVGDLGARLGRHEAARRSGRDRGLLVAGTLANEAAGADRAILHLLRAGALRSSRLRGSRGRSGGRERSLGSLGL